MALRLCSDGKADYALFLLLTFETYMRPSEALSLVGLQLVPPVPNERGACQFWTILIRASELDVLGKTGEFDTSVALDLPRHRLLESALRLLKANRGERERLFLFHYTDFLLAWNSCLLGLGLAQLKVTPYSLRHGGASEDVSSRSRALLDVQKRGGWRSFQSVRRYEKHARLASMMRRIPAQLREEAQRRERELARLLLPACGRRVQMLPC
jgi:integrase